MPLTIGAHMFASQVAAKAHTRALLLSCACQARVCDADTISFLHALIARHPRGNDKTAGVVAFSVSIDAKGSPQLLIHTALGSDTISWVSCVTAAPTTHTQRLNEAMRLAVAPSISAWKRATPQPLSCPGCCLPALDLVWHADHVEPFCGIARNFLAGAGASPTSFDHDDATRASRFRDADAAFSEAWVRHHDAVAKLAWLCGACNCAKGAKGAQGAT